MGSTRADANPHLPLDEFELIAAIRERLARAGAPPVASGLLLGSGDDAAISEHAGAVVTSVDALVEGVHFRLGPASFEDAGAKALAVALSDIAAMGANAAEAYVQVGIPSSLADEDVLALADGIATVAARHQVVIAGGDLTRSPTLFLAVTAVGVAASAERLVRRDGALAGDAIAVTGTLGGAAAGLALLERPELERAVPEAIATELKRRQLRPEPRLDLGRRLAACGARAMIDLSDGLGGDATRVAEASAALLVIEFESVPVAAGVDLVATAAGLSAAELATGGGEDYELLITMPDDRVGEATESIATAGSTLTVIGRVEPGAGVELRRAGGGSLPARGFDQLQEDRERDEPA